MTQGNMNHSACEDQKLDTKMSGNGSAHFEPPPDTLFENELVAHNNSAPPKG
jgi:hypothetical protein